MKLVILTVISILLFSQAFAANTCLQPKEQNKNIAYSDSQIKKDTKDSCVQDIAFTLLTKREAVERKGCCSHHGGVCGCSSDGRAVCCDGAPSPSCGC
jgi:hypothetical protein